MCYYVDSSLTKKDIRRIYNIGTEGADYTSTAFMSGFTHEKLQVILDETPQELSAANWGLIPFWAKDEEIRRQTLNAKIETIKDKPAFRKSYDSRCLVLVKGFYEWKWLDTKGREKHKHYLTLKNQEVFSLAGIYSHWTNPETEEELTTFSVVTTQANELMAEIHNIKHRMPVVLYKARENDWLRGAEIEEFAYPNHECDLQAVDLDYRPTLFD